MLSVGSKSPKWWRKYVSLVHRDQAELPFSNMYWRTQMASLHISRFMRRRVVCTRFLISTIQAQSNSRNRPWSCSIYMRTVFKRYKNWLKRHTTQCCWETFGALRNDSSSNTNWSRYRTHTGRLMRVVVNRLWNFWNIGTRVMRIWNSLNWVFACRTKLNWSRSWKEHIAHFKANWRHQNMISSPSPNSRIPF